MRWEELHDDDCPLARALSVLEGRWTLIIVRECLNGVTRFDDFHERLGCSRMTLSQRLSHLIDAGILQAVEYQANPPRRDYVLSAKGQSLSVVLASMSDWAESWMPTHKI
jgi:DNA-binding HxlR family transcriptional regulator